MQKGIDSKIQAQVRILLTRRWVDLRTVTIGTTNGVVYIGGTLKRSAPPSDSGGPANDDGWVRRIRGEISAIPEVRDVVFQADTGGAQR
jgi:hypothetical protein